MVMDKSRCPSPVYLRPLTLVGLIHGPALCLDQPFSIRVICRCAVGIWGSVYYQGR